MPESSVVLMRACVRWLARSYVVSSLLCWLVFIAFNAANYKVTYLYNADRRGTNVTDPDGNQVPFKDSTDNTPKQWQLSFGYLFLTNCMLMIVGYFIETSVRGAYLQMQKLRYEQFKTNLVLYNILPKGTGLSLCTRTSLT